MAQCQGHLQVAYQCKGLDQSNNVCEYEVNLSTNEKLITEEKKQCWLSRSSEGQGHNATCWWKWYDLSYNVCQYEVIRLTNDKVITEIQYMIVVKEQC